MINATLPWLDKNWEYQVEWLMYIIVMNVYRSLKTGNPWRVPDNTEKLVDNRYKKKEEEKNE